MNNLQNIGTNFYAYLPLVAVLLIGLVIYFIARTGWKMAKLEDTVEDAAARAQLSKTYIRTMVIGVVAVVFLIFSLFFAFGHGKRPRTIDYEKSGWLERTEKLPDEKPLEEIQKEGELNKDKTGTLPDVASEKAFKEEGQQVDDEINEILKRSGKE